MRAANRQVYEKLSDEQQIYGLIVAAALKDLNIFAFLWEESGLAQHFGLAHLSLIIKQLLHSKWSAGLDFLFQSQATKQMILPLSS